MHKFQSKCHNHCGFRKGFSVQHYLLAMPEKLKRAINIKKVSGAIQTDPSQAVLQIKVFQLAGNYGERVRNSGNKLDVRGAAKGRLGQSPQTFLLVYIAITCTKKL